MLHLSASCELVGFPATQSSPKQAPIPPPLPPHVIWSRWRAPPCVARRRLQPTHSTPLRGRLSLKAHGMHPSAGPRRAPLLARAVDGARANGRGRRSRPWRPQSRPRCRPSHPRRRRSRPWGRRSPHGVGRAAFGSAEPPIGSAWDQGSRPWGRQLPGRRGIASQPSTRCPSGLPSKGLTPARPRARPPNTCFLMEMEFRPRTGHNGK